MSENVYFLTLGLVLGTILVVFGLKYLSAGRQAQARLAHDQAYREIAVKAVADQADLATAIAAIRADVRDAGARLAAIERLLKEVE